MSRHGNDPKARCPICMEQFSFPEDCKNHMESKLDAAHHRARQLAEAEVRKQLKAIGRMRSRQGMIRNDGFMLGLFSPRTQG